MRISVDNEDPGYANYLKLGPRRCFVDGVEDKHVVTADEERGFVIRHQLDDEGKHIIDKHNTVRREKVFGEVQLKPLHG